MFLSTTGSVDGYRVTEYMRIVSGETIVGINALKDIAAGFRNFVGGRSKSYENEAIAARESALSELFEQGQQMGADAVIGVKMDYSAMGAGNDMLMVTATGTAVRLERV